MTVRKRGSAYLADFMVKGKRYRETFDTYKEAEDFEADVRHAIKLGRPLPQVKNKRTETGGKLATLGKLYDHVCVTHWERMKGSSAAMIYARQVMDILGRDKPVIEITKLDLQDCCTRFFDDGNTVATVNRKMAAVSKMLTEAVEHGVIPKKPGIPKGKELTQEIRFLTVEEERRLLASAEHLGMADWCAFIPLATDTGMRLGELLRVSWDHLSPDWQSVHIWQAKSNKPRTVPLTTRARGALKFMHREGTGGPFFHWRHDGILRRSYRDQWETICHHAQVEKRIHDLRHTCASRLVQRGVDLLRVKDWLGHSEISTTLRYAHLAPNDLDVCRKALEL
jgi:integrase